MVKRERHCCGRKGPTAYSISFLVGFIKDLGFRRIIVKCVDESSTKALQNDVFHACVGVEVIPQGPLEGVVCDTHTCFVLRKFEEFYTIVSLLSHPFPHDRWLCGRFITQLGSSFCSASHEQDDNWQRRKDE